MANSKISGLSASTTPLAGTEVLPIVQSSTTKQVSVANLTAGRAVSVSTLTATTTIGVGAATPSASGAGITFPATQSASTDVNTLDDYEEGTWTPTLSFTTPGNVSVVYTAQTGLYTKIGRLVYVAFNITATPTFTTASGSLIITAAPIAATGATYVGAIHFSNLLFGAGYTMLNPRLNAISSTTFDLVQSGSGLGAAAIQTTNMVSGTAYILRGTLTYQATT